MSASKVGYLIRQVGCPHRGADTKTSPLGNTEQGNTGLEDTTTQNKENVDWRPESMSQDKVTEGRRNIKNTNQSPRKQCRGVRGRGVRTCRWTCAMLTLSLT